MSQIRFVNVYDTSIEMEWSPPLQPNGRLLTYSISYTPTQNRSVQPPQHLVLDAGQLNATLRHLRQSTEYTIGIRARTQAGDGVEKLTQIRSGVPPELPEPPRIVFIRTVGTAWAEIEFIPGYNGKTSISKWIIEAYEYDREDYDSGSGMEQMQAKWKRVDEITNAPNATRLIVENLRPFTNYSLRYALF